MTAGVATVWVPVEDMQRALGFYGETLGLTVTSRGEDWSEIDADGLTIGLNARESASPSSGGGAVISFRASGSIEEQAQRLRDAGAEVTGEVSDHPWGRIVPFKDPDGNDLQYYAPPA